MFRKTKKCIEEKRTYSRILQIVLIVKQKRMFAGVCVYVCCLGKCNVRHAKTFSY